METSELFPLESPSTSSRRASPVSRTHAPGSDWARKMTAHSGLSLARSLRECGPIGSLLRTLLASSIWRSTACYLTWKRKATSAGRSYFQLAPSTRRTGGIGSGLLPTADASMATGGRTYAPGTVTPTGKNVKTGKKVSVSLSAAIKMLPTPTARDWKDGSAKACANVTTNGLLGRVVHMLPTPTANRWDGLQSHGVNVVEGSLNPQFVEYLMNFPTDWTKLD